MHMQSLCACFCPLKTKQFSHRCRLHIAAVDYPCFYTLYRYTADLHKYEALQGNEKVQTPGPVRLQLSTIHVSTHSTDALQTCTSMKHYKATRKCNQYGLFDCSCRLSMFLPMSVRINSTWWWASLTAERRSCRRGRTPVQPVKSVRSHHSEKTQELEGARQSKAWPACCSNQDPFPRRQSEVAQGTVFNSKIKGENNLRKLRSWLEPDYLKLSQSKAKPF